MAYKTEAARCAATIRADLKKKYPKTKFTVRSETFSMGDSVTVNWCDGATYEEVRDLLCQYELGSFNGMEDIYEYDNRRDDIPQTKYLHIDRDYSAERLKPFVDEYNELYGTHLAVMQSNTGRAYVNYDDYSEQDHRNRLMRQIAERSFA